MSRKTRHRMRTRRQQGPARYARFYAADDALYRRFGHTDDLHTGGVKPPGFWESSELAQWRKAFVACRMQPWIAGSCLEQVGL